MSFRRFKRAYRPAAGRQNPSQTSFLIILSKLFYIFRVIQVQNICKSFGTQELFNDASFLVSPRERVGIVGRNGSGKSTLFKIILGEEYLDGGSIDIPKNYTLGYLRQHIAFSHKTVHEEACSVLQKNEDGWMDTHSVEAILFGLGFDEDSMQKDPMLLSGGFQIRLNLAKVLASEPNMLLLDEPTNYLDIVSMRWLSKFLRGWKGEILLITHDRKFMDEVCTHVVGIHRKKFRKIQGTVAKLKETLQTEEDVARRTQENDAHKREQLERVIDRFRFKASKAAMVQSKIKAVERLGEVTRMEHERNLEFSFNEAPFPGKRMLQIKELNFHFEGGPTLIEDLTVELFKGDRVAIIGPNGRGKTTLLNLIANELKPVAGSISLNPNILMNYFGQTNINRLNLENTVEEEIQSAVQSAERGKARSLAGLMMFSGDASQKRIRVLSGGERSRVLLGKILATPCNLLLLDEPTNHLDMESIESLIDALEDYEGTAIVVSHDEELLHVFANKLIVFDGGKCFSFDGTYGEFLEKIGWAEEKNSQMTKSVTAEAREKDSTPVISKNKDDRRARAAYIEERAKVVRPLEKEIQRIEKEIQKFEDLAKQKEAELLAASEKSDGALIAKLATELSAAKAQAEDLFAKWEETSNALESAKEKYPL